ncbi:MAG: hypothetical protein J6Y94_05865, partial [Bacteriovoracaceae bacterium]|nr:hypothetical protein [Bacteriovoracaceae bacterium]
MAAFWPIPEQELRCASFLKPYVAQMRSIHQQGTKWYFNQRNWDDYVRLLGLAWAQEVAALRPTEIWIDSGAGSGQALMDYLAQYSGQVVGISAALENWDKYWLAQAMQRYPGRFNFYVGLLETPLAYWPPLINSDILTDVYGPMAYTHAPDVVLAHYAALLRPGGKAWILLPQQGLHLYQRGRNLRTTTPLRPLAWR